MSFQTASYPGTGQRNTDAYHYSQAVRVGNIIRTSGQGGWKEDGSIITSMSEQIALAFDNALLAIKQLHPNASWKDVYAVRTYHIDMDATFDIVVEVMKSKMVDHKPIWTCVQIGKLGIEGMGIEVEIEAVVT